MQSNQKRTREHSNLTHQLTAASSSTKSMALKFNATRNPSPAEQDLQCILESAQKAAEASLNETSTMTPFAIVMNPVGQTRQMRADKDQRSGSPIDQIEHLRQRLQTTAANGGLRAGALGYIASVMNCETGQMQDAVAINLSHRDELSTVVYFPFEQTGQKPKWGASFQQAGRGEIFA